MFLLTRKAGHYCLMCSLACTVTFVFFQALISFGLIKVAAYGPEQILFQIEAYAQDFQKIHAADFAAQQVRAKEVSALNHSDPKFEIPVPIDGLKVTECDLEFYWHDRLSTHFLFEMPKVFSAAKKVEFRQRWRYVLDSQLIFIDQQLKSKYATPVAPWFEYGESAELALSLEVSRWVNQLLVKPIPNMQGGPNVAQILSQRFADEEGFIALPKLVIAKTPAESARLTGFCPLRLLPLFRKNLGPNQEPEFEMFNLKFWEVVSLVHDQNGQALPVRAKHMFSPKTEAKFVFHRWIPYLHLDGHARHLDQRPNLVVEVNPLTDILARLCFVYESGKALDDPSHKALISESFKSEGAQYTWRSPITQIWVGGQVMYGVDPNTFTPTEALRLPGSRLLGLLPR